MCRRAQEPALGKWNAPTGFLETGETLQEGAARETLEETGILLDPESLELYSVVNMVGIDQVAIVFRRELQAEPVFKLGAECSEAKFMTETEVREIDVAWGDKMGNSRELFFEQIYAHQFCVQLITTALRPGETFTSRVYSISDVEWR